MQCVNMHMSKMKEIFKMKRREEERSLVVICENCKKEHNIKIDDMKLEMHCSDYKLYSYECSCCGKKDYVREKFF